MTQDLEDFLNDLFDPSSPMMSHAGLFCPSSPCSERAAQGAWAWGMGAGVGEGHVGAKDGLTKPLSPSPGIGFKATGKLYRVPWSTVHLIRKP